MKLGGSNLRFRKIAEIDSWAEHERQHDRFTVADREIEKQVLSYAIKLPEVNHYIYARERFQP